MDSVLRWAGSKRKLLPKLKDYIPEYFERYFEPFMGSGALFFSLSPSKAVLGDLNEDLIEALDVLCKTPVKLHALVSSFPQTKRSYYCLRRSTPKDKLSRAARFVYLNRLCFNGLYRTNKDNVFNVPYGYGGGELPSLLCFRQAAARLRNATLLPKDFEKTLAFVRKNDFVYLDPPYVYSTRKDRGEYGTGSFSCVDLPRLFAVLTKLNDKGAFFLLSYLDCEDIAPYLGDWHVTRIPVQRQIASFVSKRAIVNELLISNYPLSAEAPYHQRLRP
jgi:DNA adenine methylase